MPSTAYRHCFGSGIGVILISLACSPPGTVGSKAFTGGEGGPGDDTGPGSDGSAGSSGNDSSSDASVGDDSVGDDSVGDDSSASGLASEGSSSVSGSDGVTSDTEDPTGGGEIKFDMPPIGGDTTGNPGDGPCGCGNEDWSYVWLANSMESTVTKLNTRTLVEEGRYITRPDKSGNPSRTSVSIDGRAVAVANRNGGIVKIWARPELCAGGNTSAGKDDIKAWGTDDCVAWYTAFSATSQRPIQWTSGALNPATCRYENQKIWTTTCSGGAWVHRLNGDTGMVEDEFPVPEISCFGYGAYGGAVDAYGNFWFHDFESDTKVRVDFNTLGYEVFHGNGVGYGVIVDTKGRTWWSGAGSALLSRFDYATKTWGSAPVSDNGGLAQDLQGRIWAAQGNELISVDMETLVVGDRLMIPGSQLKGVSVDIDGYIWAVPAGSRAFKIDPNDFTMESYDGLNFAYTYSDMTGGTISNVTCNPPEG